MSASVKEPSQPVLVPLLLPETVDTDVSIFPAVQPPSNLEGLWNFRDVGGCRAEGSRMVRRGLIYRSGNLDDVSLAGFRALRDKLQVRCVFDLRSGTGETRPGDGWVNSREAVPIHHVVAMNWTSSRDPVQKHLDLLSQDIVAAFMVIYKHLMVESAPAFAKIFAHIRDNPGDSIMVHCDLGKDRTGMFIGLLLQTLGVSDEDIAADYQLSEAHTKAVSGPKSEKFRRSSILTMPPEGIEGHFLAPAEVMREFLRYVQEAYGGGEGYLRFLGFERNDVNRIRENALVEIFQRLS